MFSEKERQVYQCPETKRFYDPLSVKRKLVIAGKGQFNKAVAVYNGGAGTPEELAQAEGILVASGREALGMPAINPATGEGHGDASVILAVTAFTRWLRGKDGTVQSGPNSAPCTDCPQAAR